MSQVPSSGENLFSLVSCWAFVAASLMICTEGPISLHLNFGKQWTKMEFQSWTKIIKVKVNKAIPLTGRGGLHGFEILRISHCIDSLLTDGGKFVSPTHPPRFTPQKHFSASGTHFCQRLSKPQGLLRPERLGELKKLIHLIRSRTRDLQA
jgi:hypothetical protein